MPKAKKVHCPGSRVPPAARKKKGRPKTDQKGGKVVKKGTRRKGNYRSKYTQEDFKLAMESIQDGMSVRKAAEEFNVPRVTLMDRLHNRTTDKLGRPCELSEEEENLLSDRIKLMGDWGFPLTMIDVRKLVQDYFNSTGKRSRWVDNYPGEDWAYGFVKRRKDLSNRMSNLIKRSRAALSRDQVKEFMENYTKVAGDIPPSNVFNYDETNLTEDPGAKKALFRRGVKYAEKVSNHSKASLSVMFCGSADGKMLAPYVVYKAKNLYESWCQGGPKGTRYNATPSGWFDMYIFEDWFKKSFLAEVRRIPGRKVLIGDNLASHISTNVIELCKQNNIEFVCLPPNSTHVLQPLDVAVYGPLKAHWRKLLRDLLEKEPEAKALNKTKFPALLKKLTERLDSEVLLPKGFEKCGIYPISCDKPFSRIPDRQFSAEQMSSSLDNSLLETLEVRRFNKDGGGGRGRGRGGVPGRGRKVAPGKSYSRRDSSSSSQAESEDEECVEGRGRGRGGPSGRGDQVAHRQESGSSSSSQSESEDEEGGGGRGRRRGRGGTPGRGDKVADRMAHTSRAGVGDIQSDHEQSNDSSESESEVNDENDRESSGSDENNNSDLENKNSDVVNEHIPHVYEPISGYTVGSFVVALYEMKWYVAQVEGEDPDEETEGFTLLDYMHRKGFNQFSWGDRRDILKTNNKDIICAVNPPIPISSRAMGLKQEDLEIVLAQLQ